jgi:hypothetical protein
MSDVVAPLAHLVESALASRHQTQAGQRLAYHASLRDGLKEVPGALSKLDALLAEEAEAFCKSEEYLLRRKFSSNIFSWAVFFSIATLMAIAFGFVWTVQSWSAGWGYWVLLGMSMLVGALVGWTIVLFRAVYWVPQSAAQPSTP